MQHRRVRTRLGVAAVTLTLTPRQTDVARLAAEGFNTPEIAAQLGISKNTAKTHLIAVRNKLGVAHKRELVRVARDYLATADGTGQR